MSRTLKLALVFFCTASLAIGQEIKRPTSGTSSNASVGCIGNTQTASSMPNAFDAAGLVTSSTQSVAGGNCVLQGGRCVVGGNIFVKIMVFSSWQTTGNTYSSLTLNINSRSDGFNNLGGTQGGNASLAYSLNSGTTWTQIRGDGTGNGWGQTTDSVSLSSGQSLAALRVGVCVQGNGATLNGNDQGRDDIIVYDIWTAGTNSGSPPAGNGSGQGKIADPVFITRWWGKFVNLIAGKL
jgi:hypothetical protein